MAKVYGIQEIELRPDVTEAEFERYFREEIGTIERVFPGFKMCLAKSDRGARNGKYAIVIEIESVEARNRMNPMPDVVERRRAAPVGGNRHGPGTGEMGSICIHHYRRVALL